MDSAIVSEAGGCASGGLQMLLDRWRLQEEKLLDFEDSLKEVNKSMAYQPVQERREASNNPEMALQRKLSVIGGAVLGTSVQDEMIRVPSAQSMTSSDDDSGLRLRKGTYKGVEDMAMLNDESMEDFEKRIWATVWKDEALLDDYLVDGSCCTGTFLENDLQGEYSDMAPVPASVLLKNDLRGAENAAGKEFSPQSLFQHDFQGLPVRDSPSTADNFATPSGLEVRPQTSSIRPCLDHVIMSPSFRSDPRTGTTDSEGLGVSVESENFPLAREKEELLEMAVNLVSPGLWSSSQSNEECSNLNELSTQRASFVESIMAAEAQRQMDREKEQLRRTEALKQEEEAAAANMERVLQNPLQLEQEEKQASIEEEACSRQQRVEELQRELESSNAHLKKLTENWNFFGKETDLNTQSVAEYFKSRRLEEERRSTAAQRIARAFRKRKCRVLNNCCISIQKVVRGFLCRQKVQELKGQRCKRPARLVYTRNWM